MRTIGPFKQRLLVLFSVIVTSTQIANAQTPIATGEIGSTVAISAAVEHNSGSSGSNVSPSVSASTQATSPPSTLICRMGGNMVWSLVNQFDVVQTQINGQNVRVPVVAALFEQLKFARGGAAGRDGASLQPGYCGWIARAMTASDPELLVADVDKFTFQATVQWGNGSTIKGETTMGGGSLNFQNKQVFSVQVTLFGGVMLKVAPGTKPKAL